MFFEKIQFFPGPGKHGTLHLVLFSRHEIEMAEPRAQRGPEVLVEILLEKLKPCRRIARNPLRQVIQNFGIDHARTINAAVPRCPADICTIAVQFTGRQPDCRTIGDPRQVRRHIESDGIFMF